MVQTGNEVAIAFGIVMLAGASTMAGAAFVFFPSIVKLASRRVLAGSLGLSSGVMIYISFVEILQASLEKFIEGGKDYDTALVFVTVGFFGGILIMIVIDKIVHFLSGDTHHGHYHSDQNAHSKVDDAPPQEINMHSSTSSLNAIAHCLGCVEDPVKELEKWHKVAEKELNKELVIDPLDRDGHAENCCDHYCEKGVNEQDTIESYCENGNGACQEVFAENSVSELPEACLDLENRRDCADTHSHSQEKKKKVHENPHEKKKLKHSGIKTAIAIAIHNFPEGLAVFATSLDDPRIGGVLAFAIAIHNIPEGLCVALPIYYGTGKRCKAFLLAALSGLSEPLGAFLGWLFLSEYFSDYAYAILYAIVAGMMVMICVKELLPTAHRFDPCDTVISYSFVVGMLIIATSIALFHMFSDQHNHDVHESHSEESTSSVLDHGIDDGDHIGHNRSF